MDNTFWTQLLYRGGFEIRKEGFSILPRPSDSRQGRVLGFYQVFTATTITTITIAITNIF